MLHNKELEKSKNVSGRNNSRPPYWTIYKQAFPQLFNVFFVFFVTLSIFPGVHSGEQFRLEKERDREYGNGILNCFSVHSQILRDPIRIL